MILFIHGFGSCGWGAKSLQLRRHVGIDSLLAPDLPFRPCQAMAHLRDLVDRYPVRALVGSSLGGFYATALNAAVDLPAVLVNPVVAPHRLLAQYLGVQHRWCDDAPFTVTADYLDELRDLYRERLATHERYLVLLQRGDETLDYRVAARHYAAKDVVEIPGGSHRFDRFDACLPRIDGWLAQQGVEGG